jgi:hypothetical protein
MAASWMIPVDEFKNGGRKGGAGNEMGGLLNIQKYPPRRFWMKAGERKRVLFVDSPLDASPIDEYALPLNGDWRQTEYLTTTRLPSCPLLQRFKGDYRHMVAYCTVVDVDGYVSKTGEAKGYQVMLYPVKPKQYQKHVEDLQDDGPVNGQLTLVRRVTSDDARSGEIKKREEAVDMAAAFPFCNYQGRLLSEWWDEADANPAAREKLLETFSARIGADGKLVREVVPFNYEVLLAPKSAAEIAAILGDALVPPQERRDGGGAKKPGAAPSAAPAGNPFGKNLFPTGAPPAAKALPPASPRAAKNDPAFDDADDSDIPF